jgi:hypothetical protein
MIRLLLPLCAVLLAACHDERPPAPTKEESARLDQADAMLNDAARNEQAP